MKIKDENDISDDKSAKIDVNGQLEPDAHIKLSNLSANSTENAKNVKNAKKK